MDINLRKLTINLDVVVLDYIVQQGGTMKAILVSRNNDKYAPVDWTVNSVTWCVQHGESRFHVTRDQNGPTDRPDIYLNVQPCDQSCSNDIPQDLWEKAVEMIASGVQTKNISDSKTS